MELRIWIGKGYKQFKADDIVMSTKAVHSFAAYNNLRDCIFKTQGGYYKLHLNGILTFEFKHLNFVTFEQLYNILKD